MKSSPLKKSWKPGMDYDNNYLIVLNDDYLLKNNGLLNYLTATFPNKYFNGLVCKFIEDNHLRILANNRDDLRITLLSNAIYRKLNIYLQI